jgi:hypothetical protein
MKKIILLFIIVTNLFSAHGQIINELVNFNTYVSPTNNDFVNHFNNGLGLTQITTNGITGGCLTVPAIMDWGNDNAVYCSKFVADSGSYCKTYISFKYDTTLYNSSGIDRAVSIFLRPSTDFNHYIIASVSHSHRIEILTYSWTNSPGLLVNLIHDHWYMLVLRVPFVGGPTNDQVDINAGVLDLGITGQSPPNSIGAAIGTINDSVLFADTAIQVSFTATSNGGAKYIDDFQFEGIKSADSCISIPTGFPEKPETDFSVFVSGNELMIQNVPSESKTVAEIYSANGQWIHSIPLKNYQTALDISGWTKGIYFVRLKTRQSATVKKIAIML